MNLTTSRRHFLGAVGAAAVMGQSFAGLLRGEPARDNIHVAMMLQSGTAANLQKQAHDIAAVGFDSVQLSFFFEPSLDELKAVAETLNSLKLKVAALGTYFNLFRPDDTSFMGSSQKTMQLLAAHPDLFGCRQFVSWSGTYAPQLGGIDPRNHTREAIAEVHRAIREILLPIIEPIDGRIAFEPYHPHAVGTLEGAKKIFAPFPANRIGLVMDPPNYVSPKLYPQRQEVLLRLFRDLGDRVHLAHFKDLKLNAATGSVDLPGAGTGEMDYPSFIAEIRKLRRPVACIIEHIPAEPAVMQKTKAFIEAQLRKAS